MPIDTSRMSVEQMRALSAEKQDESAGKKKGEREWRRHAEALEYTLLQGFPAQAITNPEESGFPGELWSCL